MYKKEKYLALIVARKGSRGLKEKNLKTIARHYKKSENISRITDKTTHPGG